MSTLLHIDSSVRAANNPNPDHDSISKNIARRFIETWQRKRPDDDYIYRDVGVNPPDFITQDWIGAVFTPEEKRTPAQRETGTIRYADSGGSQSRCHLDFLTNV